MASGEFRKIKQAWNHANLTRHQKLEYFQAFVVPRLQYLLSTAWLVRAQRRRLDGFYARCLRKILGIPAAFISRVPNAKVFEEAGRLPLSEQLLRHQLMLLGRVGRSPSGSPLRRDTFVGGTALPMIGSHVRRVGRPRQDWTSQVLAEAERRAGSHGQLVRSLLDVSADAEQRWKPHRQGWPRAEVKPY